MARPMTDDEKTALAQTLGRPLASDEMAEMEAGLTAKPHKHWLVLDPDNDPQGSAFKAHPGVNRWAVIKMAKAESSGDDAQQAGAFYDLVMTIVIPEERERLDAYMMEHGDDEGMTRMSVAVGRFTQGETGLPLGPSPASSSSSSETNSGTEANSSEPVTEVQDAKERLGRVFDETPIYGTVTSPPTAIEHYRVDLSTGTRTPVTAQEGLYEE